ncbi:MAG: S41 family peptidase [Pseudomonadota bacterium]
MNMTSRMLTAITVGCALTAALLVSERLLPDKRQTALATDAQLLTEVLERVQSEYVDPIEDSVLLEAAVRGMVADLDAHSEFLDKSQFEHVREGASGRYSGVGIEVTLEDDQVTVIAPFAGSPAARAGIRSGDVVVAVDEVPVTGDALYSTVQRMRGAPGTYVSLSVLRDARTLEFSLRREQLTLASVSHRLLSPDVGYLKISQFHERTVTEVRAAVQSLEDSNLTPLGGLIIDLRNNPGGLLDAAIDVADLFLDEGLIVSARGRAADAVFEHHATPGMLLAQTQLVVLVNGASASAAEILAGALHDHQRAQLVGSSTFGKGLVQTVMPLSRGQAIKLTTSRYYTPNGDYIHDRGITPDIVVRDSNTASDADDKQLQRAQRELARAQPELPGNL